LLVLTTEGYFFVYQYDDELASLELVSQRRFGEEEGGEAQEVESDLSTEDDQ
uniref:Sen15 domain-containing protein n=1 Tax=Steinernema glaseri TaxID=37863 RepID=A0A1I8ADR8_9BILA